ncbi:MAG TPA: NAD-dependent epimerase/dehydratase family protein [Luteolibacter sp.]|nr:NAD-dependent epimerase/dehydratase family protein [Luteolibacter sp.]
MNPEMMDEADKVAEEDFESICSRLGDEMRLMEGGSLLMTGGAGFLGYSMVQAVIHWNRTRADGNPIRLTVCDNYIRGVPRWLENLGGEPAMRLVKHDITRPLPDDLGGFDFIVHAASIASPVYYRKYPIETMDANVQGLRLLLDRSRDWQSRGCPLRGFLFFSTSEIYGDPPPDCIPTPESYRGNVSCTGPRACYDESKRYGETLCVNFARQYGMPVAIARPFNNYGPGLKITDRRVLPDFARDLFAGRDLTLLSDGSPTRTFCYVADAVTGYFKILTRGRAGEAYNIGNESPEISMAALAESLADIARETIGYRGRVVRQQSSERDYLTDNPQRRCPVIAKARTELGFEPTVPLEEGLRRTLVWYSANQQADDA